MTTEKSLISLHIEMVQNQVFKTAFAFPNIKYLEYL